MLKWILCETLTRTGLLRLLESKTQRSARILVFHRVRPTRVEDGMTVSESVFEAQLQFLRERYHLVSLDEVSAMVRGACPMRPGTVAITFDDGYADNYTRAWPVLVRHKVPVTIFLAVGAVDADAPLWTEQLRHAVWASPSQSVDLAAFGWERWPLRTQAQRWACLQVVKSRLKAMADGKRKQALHGILQALEWEGQEKGINQMLTWDMVREMQKADVTIGAHTISHKILTRLDPTEAEWEIAQSKRRIEEQLGEPVRHFAFPNGTRADWNPDIQEIVRQCGFETACTTVRGTNPVGHDPYALRRLEITDAGCTDPFGRFSTAMFATQLAGVFGGWEQECQRSCA